MALNDNLKLKCFANKLKLSFTVLPFIVAVAVSFSFEVNAQQNSDIWVAKLNLWEKEPITELVQITNTDSYTNQPYFFDNTRLFYTQAIGIDDEKFQTDVWLFNFKLGTNTNITESLESEYSPTPVPNSKNMSVIKVNDAGKQELWEINQQGKVLKDLAHKVEPVGYQVWLNNKELLLFVLGEPNTLQRIDTTPEGAIPKIIDTNIGASLFRFEKTNWFLYTSNLDGNFLNAYNSHTNKIIQIVRMPKNSEYFSVSPMGNVITSDGETLWRGKFMVKGEKIKAMNKWQEIKIDHDACGKGISRTAISPDTSMIALVCPRS